MSCKKNEVMIFSQRIDLVPDATVPGFSVSSTIAGIEFHSGSPFLFRLTDPKCEFEWDGSAEFTTDMAGFRFTLTPVSSGFTLSAQNMIQIGRNPGPAITSVSVSVYEKNGLFLPAVSSSDNGKIMIVENGAWILSTLDDAIL